jgi:hypothetical protein
MNKYENNLKKLQIQEVIVDTRLLIQKITKTGSKCMMIYCAGGGIG